MQVLYGDSQIGMLKFQSQKGAEKDGKYQGWMEKFWKSQQGSPNIFNKACIISKKREKYSSIFNAHKKPTLQKSSHSYPLC